jgi:hypothetical protein
MEKGLEFATGKRLKRRERRGLLGIQNPNCKVAIPDLQFAFRILQSAVANAARHDVNLLTAAKPVYPLSRQPSRDALSRVLANRAAAPYNKQPHDGPNRRASKH